MSLTDFFGDLGSDIGNLFSGGGSSGSSTSGGGSSNQSGQDYINASPQQQVSQDIGSTDSTGGALDTAVSGALGTNQSGSGASGGSWLSELGSRVGNWLSEPSNLLKVGLGVGGGALGLYESNQAQKQGAAATSAINQIPANLQQITSQTTAQLQNISQQYQAMVTQAASAMQQMSAPMMQQFQQLLNLTNQGQLTPANQQIMDAARAQLAQAAANSGGVGAEQAQTKLDTLRNQLLGSQQTQALQLYQTASPAQISGLETQLSGAQQANQYQQSAIQEALQSAGIEDQYALQAITTGLQNDQQARSSMGGFYSALANVLAGTPIKTTST